MMKKIGVYMGEIAIIFAIVAILGFFVLKTGLPGEERRECLQWKQQLKGASASVLATVALWQNKQCQRYGIELTREIVK